MAENNQSRTARRKRKKTKKKSIWKPILITLLLLILATGVAIGGIVTYWIASAPSIDESKLHDSYASVILDKDGNEVAMPGEAGGEKRVRVTYDELPEMLVDAVLATEDSRFFEHSGIDTKRIGAAVVANIKRGFGAEGASTITQQVVEKSFLTPEKKISLKVQEAWLALQLERQFSKEEILEFYLNKIFYGNHSYGVAQAANNYFDKDLDEITLPEAALLAGLPQRPTAYNPFENPELAQSRMDTVLTLMVRHGKITEEEADEAREVDVSSLLVEPSRDSTPYDAFVDQVAKEVEEKLDADIFTDGLTVHTTLDTNVQDHVEYLLSEEGNNVIPYPDDEMKAGMVVLDTKSGAIQAIGGRRDDGSNEFNYAINGGSQAGSTAKPLLSFGPAIEHNQISTYHQINDDGPFQVGDHQVQNWNRSHGGWMSARHALTQSLNVPTLKLMEEVGLENAKEFAEGIGYEFESDTIGITEGLGGADKLTTPLELAGAYRAFGNQGIYNEPYAVVEVEFPNGATEDLKPESEAAMSDYTAYMITDMLKSVVKEGTGTGANIEGLPMAGKTGTTNLTGKSGSPDAWFAGYTTNFTIAAWTGGYEDENENRDVIPQGYTHISQELFRNTMAEISQGVETQDFVKPDSVVEVEVEDGSNPPALPSGQTPSSNIVTELFVKGTEPTSKSETFAKLDPVSDLSATYNEDSDVIDVSWSYDGDEDVSFEVSASVDEGSMEALSTTDDTSLEISQVESGNTYEIQVIAVSNEDNNQSEPRSVTVSTGDEEDEDEEVPAVTGLQAIYREEQDLVDVTWEYDGPDASFTVAVNGDETQTVESNGVEISNVTPGETYTISVTPVSNANDEQGESASTEITIPDEEDPEEDEDEEEEQEEPDEEPEEDEEQNNDNNGDDEEEEDSPPEDDAQEDNDDDDTNNDSENANESNEENQEDNQDEENEPASADDEEEQESDSSSEEDEENNESEEE